MTMSVAYELEINKINTAEYIESDPTDAVFTPRSRVSDGAGGFTWVAGAPLAPQRIRAVTDSGRMVSAVRRTVEGESVTPDMLLIALWDADIERGYLLTIIGDLYEVVYIQPDTRYEMLIEVTRRG